MAKPRRLGSEVPRIWTPPLRELTPETSLGFAAIAFAAQVCGIDLFPWQKWLLIHALELADDLVVTYDEDGSPVLPKRAPMQPLFRFRKIVVLVARQNGKSTLSQVLSLFFLYVLGVDLILGTAQDLDTAEEVWDGVLDIIEDTPDLAALADKPIKVNGKKTIRLKDDDTLGVHGQRYKVKAANRRAGRGLSGDLILLDELREHQSFDAWAAITKTTQARPAAMIWALSNAGDASSVVLRTLRKMAHAALGDPDGICRDDAAPPTADELNGLKDLAPEGAPDLTDADLEDDPQNLGLFEWSAPPGCDVMDPAGWAWSNPSMGYGIDERTIAGDAKTEGRDPLTEWVFRTEVLCQWADGALRGPFPSGAWDRGLNTVIEHDDGSRSIADADKITGPFRVAIDMSHDRSRTYIARAAVRADGVDQVEIWEGRAGAGWVADFLMEHRHEIADLTGQASGAPISPLLANLAEDPEFTIPIVTLAGSDLTGSFGVAHDAVRDNEVRHNPQPVLDVAAATTVIRELGESKVIDRRHSPGDAAPLMAWCAALWLLRKRPKVADPPPPPVALKPAKGRPVRSRGSIATAGF